MLSKAEKTQRARKVGRMPYEQVRALFDEIAQQRNGRRECPNCSYFRSPNWEHCEAYEEEVKKGYDLLERSKVLRVHEKTCPDCHIRDYYVEFESFCDECQDINDRFHLYSRRLQHIAAKEQIRQFQEAHGRKPASPLELLEWQDTQVAGHRR